MEVEPRNLTYDELDYVFHHILFMQSHVYNLARTSGNHFSQLVARIAQDLERNRRIGAPQPTKEDIDDIYEKARCYFLDIPQPVYYIGDDILYRFYISKIQYLRWEDTLRIWWKRFLKLDYEYLMTTSTIIFPIAENESLAIINHEKPGNMNQSQAVEIWVNSWKLLKNVSDSDIGEDVTMNLKLKKRNVKRVCRRIDFKLLTTSFRPIFRMPEKAWQFGQINK